MKSTHTDMLTGSIAKGLLSMTIPIMIMNVTQSLFNIIDMTTLRYFSNESAVGAVGACGSLITLCVSLLVGISAGANVVVAKHIGAGDKEQTDNAVVTAILLSLIGGIAMMVIGLIFARDFLVLTNCPDSLLPQASSYFRIYFLGFPVSMFYNFCAAILRATGDTRKPMYFLILGSAIKVSISLFVALFFRLSVEIVAFATIISNLVISFLAFRAILRNDRLFHVNFKKIRLDFKEMRSILFVGVPAGMQSAMYSFANVIITSTVNTFGPDATTGISIANQFDGILYQIAYAPSLATIPYVAQNVGAGNIRRVKQTILRSILIAIGFAMTLGSLSAIFSRELSSIMSDSPAVIDYSHQKMVIISSTYFICGINDVIGGVLKGMGKPFPSAISTLVFMCLLRFVWVYWIFPVYPNLTFLYLVWPIGWILSIATLLIILLPAISRLQKKHSALNPQLPH